MALDFTMLTALHMLYIMLEYLRTHLLLPNRVRNQQVAGSSPASSSKVRPQCIVVFSDKSAIYAVFFFA